MAYENDFIMRQVRDMTRMLAKILFGKNTATYEYQQEDNYTAADSLYARLITMVDAGKINEAENRLYEELDPLAESIVRSMVSLHAASLGLDMVLALHANSRNRLLGWLLIVLV